MSHSWNAVKLRRSATPRGTRLQRPGQTPEERHGIGSPGPADLLHESPISAHAHMPLLRSSTYGTEVRFSTWKVTRLVSAPCPPGESTPVVLAFSFVELKGPITARVLW